MKDVVKRHKDSIILFSLIVILYSAIASIFLKNTTIFYDTYGTYNVLLDTDTGVLFNWNTFAISQDNSKHILFSSIVSLLAYPIYSISDGLSKAGHIDYKYAYGIGLTILQIVVSATSITLIHSCIKTLNIKKTTSLLIITIMIVSFPQVFMSLNIERFIYAQLSLVFFLFLLFKLKNKESYLIDIAAIPLLGVTLTNVYLYFINLILEFKLNLKKILSHTGIFVLASYIAIIATKSYNSIFEVSGVVQSDTQFILVAPIIEKFKMVILRLIYPVFYFPGYEISYNKMNQNGDVNKIFLVLIILALVLAIIGGVKNFKEKTAKICLGILLSNFMLHGIIGYNLMSANIMAIHFTFSIIVLLAYFAKGLNEKQNKIFNIFLGIVILTILISNMQGFGEILKLGMSVYPK